MTESYNARRGASTPIEKPPSAHVDDEAAARIPAELRELPRWVCWRWVWRPNKNRGRGGWDKPPINPHTGKPTDATDEAAWMPFDRARELAHHLGDGIGFALGEDGPYCCADLDHVIDEHGEVAEWAEGIIRRLASYTEITPSGRGLRVWIKARLPRDKEGRTRTRTSSRPGLEFYDCKRYLTVTGNVAGDVASIEDRGEELAALHVEVFGSKQEKRQEQAKRQESKGPDLADDDELIRRARAARNGAKFSALFDAGDTSGYAGDDSAADFALCGLIGFWTGPDPARVERIFGRSALGQRDKWTGRSDYRERTISNALDGIREFYSSPSSNGHTNGRAAQTNGAAPPADLPSAASFKLTDMGNGERLVHMHGRDIRYVAPWKKWLEWDGARWAIDPGARVARRAKKTVRWIYVEAACNPDLETRKATADWAKASESNGRVEAMIKQASSEESIEVRPRELDRDPWLLNCLNGTVDLRTGELREHRREDLITQLCPVAFDPEAACPLWESTLGLVFEGNVNLIGYWQLLCGCILTGTVSEQILPIAHGSGENGKSTLVNTLQEMLGPDYAMKAPPNFLMVKRHESHPTELADLFGKRLVVAIETGEGARINEVLIKELTGSDPIRARRMREDFWQFNPTHKVILCTNHRPTVRGTDHAIWRRIHLVPFNMKIPADRKDKAMPARLAGELPGILAWCVRGCLEWRKAGGLEPPAEVTEATSSYRAEQDVIARFLEETCKAIPSEDSITVKASALYAAYKVWAERAGETPVSQKTFGDRMTEKGFRRKTNNGTWYLGVGLVQEAGF